MSKLSKAERRANNIQIMLKSKTSRSLCIRGDNEKAFQLAVKQLGMRLDQFDILRDGFYLEIRLKQDAETRRKIAFSNLRGPTLSQGTTL